jgi:hypothetical protein
MIKMRRLWKHFFRKFEKYIYFFELFYNKGGVESNIGKKRFGFGLKKKNGLIFYIQFNNNKKKHFHFNLFIYFHKYTIFDSIEMAFFV